MSRRSSALVALPVQSATESGSGVAPLDPRRSGSRPSFDGIIGASPALTAVLREVELAALFDIAVLITGATGTGKTQHARVIHESGPRCARRFMDINCSAIPDTLFERELFGAVPGAYTGATVRMDGKVAGAQGGTLFLDEVGELTETAQAKLLQFLHTGEYYPLGSSVVRRADVRVIAATNVDLPEAVRQKRFRSDLLFRLQGLCIRMPSLAERPEDLGALAEHAREAACRKYKLEPIPLSTEALGAIETAEWRGNVRELANVIGLAAVRAAAEGASSIEASHVFPNGRRRAAEAPASESFHAQTRRFQRSLVVDALEKATWNVSRAASSLEMSRAHLHNLMKALDVKRPQLGG